MSDRRTVRVDMGVATTYGAAVRGGYSGTYEQYCLEQATVAGNAATLLDFINKSLLESDEIMGATEAYTFNNGKITSVVHSIDNQVVRTDIFQYGEHSITETRTSPGGTVRYVIETNTETLKTTTSYVNV